MTREKALASLPEKFRKEAARNFSIVRAALKACANEVEAALALPSDAPVRVSVPTLTLTREEVGEGLGWTSDKTGVYIPWDDFPKVADRLNAILAAKSQRGEEPRP